MLRLSNLVLVLLVVQAVVYANAAADFKQSRNMWNDAMAGAGAWMAVRNWEILKEKGSKPE
jgi:hypothetical protein